MKLKSILSLSYRFLLFCSVIFVVSCRKNSENKGAHTFSADHKAIPSKPNTDPSLPHQPSGPIIPSFEEPGSDNHDPQGSSSQRKYFFYQVKREGKISYILGTMHAGLEEDYFSTKIIDQFKKCDTILVEANRAEFKEKYSSEIQNRLTLPENDSTENHLAPEVFAKLINTFKNYNVDYEVFKNKKAYAYNAYIDSISDRLLEDRTKLHWNFDHAIDAKLLAISLADPNKKTLYLDNEEFMLNKTINEIETGYTWQDLANLLAYEDPIQHLMDCALTSRDIYLSGKLENLNTILKSQCTRQSFFEEINQRSQQWHPTILKAFSEGNSCAAFGAAHLINEGGILEALQAEGFEITQPNL